jgi:hypothetical protein
LNFYREKPIGHFFGAIELGHMKKMRKRKKKKREDKKGRGEIRKRWRVRKMTHSQVPG